MIKLSKTYTNLKPKEPLLAIMFSFILTGLGQIYSGRVKRGILFFCISFISIPILLYVVSPNTKINPLFLLLLIFGFGFGIFVIVDAYRSAKAYNISNNLTRKITAGKKALLIIGILFFAFIFNPTEIISIYIKHNIVQAFKIPAETMKPTLLEGDRILVDKRIYKKSEPRRGDIIAFIYPEDTKKSYIKRLVGLPKETIEIKNGSILINGMVLKEPLFEGNHYYNAGEYAKEARLITIPADSYFVLGDNSASSNDSRYWGFVPKKYLIGKAYKIYYPFNRSGAIK